jgi:hypothetical protein
MGGIQVKKLLIVGILLASFNVCAENSSREISFPKEALVEGLKDCRFFYVRIDGMLLDQHVRVVRCPNSSTSTTYNQGKQQINVQVSEGLKK